LTFCDPLTVGMTGSQKSDWSDFGPLTFLDPVRATLQSPASQLSFVFVYLDSPAAPQLTLLPHPSPIPHTTMMRVCSPLRLQGSTIPSVDLHMNFGTYLNTSEPPMTATMEWVHSGTHIVELLCTMRVHSQSESSLIPLSLLVYTNMQPPC
jgi:hypothetical protein